MINEKLHEQKIKGEKETWGWEERKNFKDFEIFEAEATGGKKKLCLR